MKVELEKVYEYGSPIRATGGTCELSGKAIVGAASTKEEHKMARARTLRSAIAAGGSIFFASVYL